MLKSFVSKLINIFYVHPDALETPSAKPSARESFFRFLLRDASGIVLLSSMLFISVTYAFAFGLSLIPLELFAQTIVYFVIRAIGLHHRVWRDRLIGDSIEDGSYREGVDQKLRHQLIPNYGRIAWLVFLFLSGLSVSNYFYPLVVSLMEDTTTVGETSSEIDPRIGEPCTTGIGDCTAHGVWIFDGDALFCYAIIHEPSSEICDNRDNDCDGVVDDNIVRSCYPFVAGLPDVGVCTTGTQTCTAGTFGACVGAIGPSTELCNDVDDDCDGGLNEAMDCDTPLYLNWVDRDPEPSH